MQCACPTAKWMELIQATPRLLCWYPKKKNMAQIWIDHKLFTACKFAQKTNV